MENIAKALPAVACIVGAIVCAVQGVEGWGIFLFVGLMIAIFTLD